MRLRVKQARPSNLNDAVRHAVELEAFNKAERKTQEGFGHVRLTDHTDVSSFKNLETGEMLEDQIPNVTGSAVWANDNKTLFSPDPPYRVFPPRVGAQSQCCSPRHVPAR